MSLQNDHPAGKIIKSITIDEIVKTIKMGNNNSEINMDYATKWITKNFDWKKQSFKILNILLNSLK